MPLKLYRNSEIWDIIWLDIFSKSSLANEIFLLSIIKYNYFEHTILQIEIINVRNVSSYRQFEVISFHLI